MRLFAGVAKSLLLTLQLLRGISGGENGKNKETDSCSTGGPPREEEKQRGVMFAQIVMGPAGSGKSSYCAAMQTHCAMRGRTLHVMNADPAAEDLKYEPSLDIRDLISIEDVKEELGPNGGLVYCIEHLTNNLDWLTEQLGENYTEDYLLIDMPGQVELYTHYRHVNHIAKCLQGLGYIVCSVYLIDSRFLIDPSTFISASLMAMACQMNLELPHFNALTKMDIVKRDNIVRKRDLESFLDPDPRFLLEKLADDAPPNFRQLNHVLSDLVADYSLVSFHPISIQDPESLNDFLMLVDTSIQYGEDAEPRMRDDEEPQEEQGLDSES